jgi:hypothetical protein
MGAKESLASVLVSLVAMSAIGYADLPILFPELESTDSSIQIILTISRRT